MNHYRIEKIEDRKEKARIIEQVLLDLPEWFGLPESTQNYIREAEDLPLWAAMDGSEMLGFITLAESSPETGDLHAMGVRKAFHNKGIGSALYRAMEDYARTIYRFLQVKTVDEGHYKEYDQTIAFYRKQGFSKLEVFPDLWDSWNPCLVMVKSLHAPEAPKENNLPLYHASPVQGLTSLEPRVSTHGKPLVYAVDNPVLALLFGAKKDDFDFIQDLSPEGVPRLHECYEGAFEKIYKGQSSSLYTLDGKGFQKGQTGWEPEYVSEDAVEVAEENYIPDLYMRLLEEEHADHLLIRRYENNPDYRERIARHVTDRLIRFGILDLPEPDERIRKHYGGILELLKEARSGQKL